MRLTGMGKFVLFLLAIGLAVGGWRMWGQMAPASGPNNGQNNSQNKGNGGFKLPDFNSPLGKNNQENNSPSNPSTQNTDIAATDESGAVQIPFMITAAKKDWVGEQVDRFNQVNAGKYKIVTQPIPSREAMHSILAGTTKPVLWSPGSPVWPARLAEAYSQKHGRDVLDLSDPNAYRVFLRSPLVFLTTKRKAQFLRPLLGGNDPWGALREISMGKRKTPWNGFRFSHADPLTSSSGVMTIGLILFDFAQKNGQTGSLTQVAQSPKFLTYLRELEKSLVYDKPAKGGTTKLTNAFLEDTTRYDVITAYESAALAAAPKNPDIAVIYPSPTAVSEHAVTLLNGDWVSAEQREGALAFMQFLGGRESLQGGLKYFFRPAQSGTALSLSSVLSRFASQGFKDTYSTVELPPYEALNTAAYRWQQNVVKNQF